MPPKFRYILVYNDGTTEFRYEVKDPIGWDTLTTVLARGEWHGVNMEQSQDLSFPEEWHGFLRDVYEEKGLSADVRLEIERRNVMWQMEPYALFRLDFSTYRDDFETVSVQLMEVSLRAKIDANMTTEYEIDLPRFRTPGDVYYPHGMLNYVGQRRMATNVMQYIIGDWQSVGGYQVFPASRSVRAYSDTLTFVNPDGTPFTHMKIRAAQNVTAPVQVTANVREYGSPALTTPLLLIRLNSDGSFNAIVQAWNGVTGGTGSNQYRDVIVDEVVSVALTSGQYVALARQQVNPNNLVISSDTFIRVSDYTTSPHTGEGLQVFPLHWLMEQLIRKIDPNGEVDPVSPLNQGAVELMLSVPDFMRNIGTRSAGKVVTTLQDALEAADYLLNIGVGVEGNMVKILLKQAMYLDSRVSSVESNNMVIEHLDEEVYNTVKVSSKFDSSNKTGNISLFSDKVFALREDSTFTPTNQKQLDITCPYIIDPLVIDETIIKFAGNSDQGSEGGKTDIVMFACTRPGHPINSTIQLFRDMTITDYIGDASTVYNLPLTPKRALMRRARLLAVSMVGGSKILRFVSAKTVVNATTSYASGVPNTRTENSDEDLSEVVPLYLPIKATFDTPGTSEGIAPIRDDPYGYVETRYRGRTIRGFVDTVSTPAGKEATQSWSLILKELPS